MRFHRPLPQERWLKDLPLWLKLMENAIDAGELRDHVELRAGGLQLIRVCDNGEGIGPEDLPIALQRYATSKLKGIEDSCHSDTGFQRKALPSIASMAQLMIKTRVPRAVSGTRSSARR
jgi:DNA mismatch repair protein MutL